MSTIGCKEGCPFDETCGDQVAKNEASCIKNIKDATGADKLRRDYTRRVKLEKKRKSIGSIRAGYIWLNHQPTPQS